MPSYGILNYVFGHFDSKHEIKRNKSKKKKGTKVFDHRGKLIFIQYPDGHKDWFNRRY